MYQGLQRIKAAAAGLAYISETDAPFHPFYLEVTESLPETLLELTGQPKGTPIMVTTLEAFFRSVLTLPPHATAEQQQRVKQYQALQSILQEALSDIKVYKIGRVEIAAFIVGRLPNGEYAGLSTQVVET